MRKPGELSIASQGPLTRLHALATPSRPRDTDGRSVIGTPQGYYTGSPGVDKVVGSQIDYREKSLLKRRSASRRPSSEKTTDFALLAGLEI
jgi:hypothetical protein